MIEFNLIGGLDLTEVLDCPCEIFSPLLDALEYLFCGSAQMKVVFNNVADLV